MTATCKPVGMALPPRRDSSIVKAAEAAPVRFDGGSDSIIVPAARDRMLELIEREQLPGDVRQTLAGALGGDLRRQQLLFQAMIDTWPRLQKAIREVKLAARKAPWRVKAWSARGKEPDSSAENLASEVDNDIWSMRPDPKRGEKGFEGTVEELVMGYYAGHHVLEVNWKKGQDGSWRPRATKPAPPRFYNYPFDDTSGDRLMLDRTGGMGSHTSLEDFPEHRFLIAVNSGHSGHPAISAPLRALTGYWLAAVYGLKWLLQFAQICGVPIRWAEYGSDHDKRKVAEMLQNIGTAGWGAFPSGTKLNFVETSKSAESIPQKVLADMADEQCDIFILGQTLTSSAGDKGSQALGTVHAGVRQDVIEGVCDFVGEVLSYQLIPSIVALNYGAARNDIPGIWVEWPEIKDEKAMAERDVALGITSGNTPVSRAWFYERHSIPIPPDNETLFKPEANGAPGEPQAVDDDPEYEDDWLDEDEADDDDDTVAASYAHVLATSNIKPQPASSSSSKRKRKRLRRGTSRIPTGSGASFDPNQKRIPKGQTNAGRWTDDGIVSKGQRAKRGVMRDATDEDRKRFGIAPGFKNAKVTDDPSADLLATAINAKGKPISIYSEAYSKKQEAAKFARISALNKEMPSLQAKIKADSESGDHQALTMRLISATGMRNGGDKGGGKVATYGASNLRTDQVKVSGDMVSMDFIGKKGVRQLQSVRDPVLARHIEARIANGKKTVFDGDANKTLDYLKKISGDKFKVHDFRTWNATVTADRTINRIAAKGELPTNEIEYKDFQMRVAKVVSRRLGNDPAMALKAYIHPAVFNGY